MSREVPFLKNDIIDLEIYALSNDGSGIGRYNGFTVFVPLTAIGDVIRARILKVYKSYAYAKVEEYVSLSNDRIEYDCLSYTKCGGCSLKHIDYKSELEYKKNKVNECLKRIGSAEISVEEIIGSQNRNRYRNKAVFPISKDFEFGFYAKGSHRVISCEDCLLQPEIFAKICDVVKNWAKTYNVIPYDEITYQGQLRRLFIRIAETTNQIMIVPVVRNDIPNSVGKLIENLKTEIGEDFTLIFNINSSRGNAVFGPKYKTVYGKGYIEDILCGIKFKLSPQSFYQVNRNQAEALYKVASEFAKPDNKVVLDLYCGTGTIGLSMANMAKNIIGVEIVEQAIEDAKINAKINNIDNANFICSDASIAAKSLSEDGINPDVVIVDPPRKGCDSEVIKTIAHDFKPENVVYVSCDPATLARDIAIFDEYNYKAIRAVAVDMFPNTSHVETVVLIKNKSVN